MVTRQKKACGCADSQSPYVGARYRVVLRDLTMRSFYIRRATYILLNIHALVDCYLCAGHDLQLQHPGSCLYPPWWKSKSPWCCWYPFKHCMYGASQRVQCTITHTEIMMQGPLGSFKLSRKKIHIIALHMERENLCQRMPTNVWGDSMAWGPVE